MDNKRILMVSCEGLGNGGVQAIMMGIIRNLSNKYHFDILLFTNEKRHYEEEFLQYGGKIFRIPHYEGPNKLKRKIDPYIRDHRIYKATKRLLMKEHPYDVIHCNKEFENAPILRAAYEVGIPIRISHTHIIHRSKRLSLKFLNHLRVINICKYATTLIGCSDSANKSIYPLQMKASIINNFYNEKKYYFKEETISNIKQNIIISQVGSLSKNKNQLFSINVVDALVDMGVCVQLNLIGFNIDLEYRKNLEDALKLKKLQKNVNFFSGENDFTNILRDSHFFIMPSVSEGFGISLIEAQAIGLYCFASTGVPNTTNCGGVEYLELDKGPKYWAKIIKNRIDNNYVTKQNFDTSNFKTEEVIKIYEEIYSHP